VHVHEHRGSIARGGDGLGERGEQRVGLAHGADPLQPE
jgi:hypothetical protein